jgi:hypothetical protein
LGEVDINHKIERFNYMRGTIKGTLKNETRMMKFYKTMVIRSGLYGCEIEIMLLGINYM